MAGARVEGTPANGGDRLVLERFFRGLLERFGRRYVHLLVSLIVVATQVAVIPLYSATLFPFFDVSTSEYLEIVAIFEIVLLVTGVAVVFSAVRWLAPVVRWTDGRRDDPEGTWRAAVVTLPRASVYGGMLYVFGCILPAIYTADVVDLSTTGAILYLTFVSILICGMIVVSYVYLEQSFRPIVRDVAAVLPEDFEVPAGTPSLRTKMLVLFMAINLFTAMFVAVISHNSLDIEGRLAVAVGATIGTTVTVSLVLNLMARQSITQRLADLRGAINAVDAGDFDVHLPTLAGDELDEVGRSLNRMAAGLKEREELRHENVGLAARVVTSSDEARRKVERDLHDGAQQHLVLLQLRLGQATRMLEKDPARVPELLRELRGDADLALEELRSLAHGIFPATLESEGLRAALDEAAHRAAISASVEGDGVPRYPREAEAAVYFCCLEALQNAAKHAGEGARAVISVSGTDAELRFEVRDDGPGFDASDISSHGLQSMTDRIRALGGQLTIESAPGRGTTVRGQVPMELSDS